jgi:ABC-type sugar transport system permease subunit
MNFSPEPQQARSKSRFIRGIRDYIYQHTAQNDDTGLASAAMVISVATLLALALLSFRVLERRAYHES